MAHQSLCHCGLVLFRVLKRVEPTAYELELAPNMRMHDVFHVSLLKKWNSEKHGVIPNTSNADSGRAAGV